METEIRNILENKLVNNDINLIDIIMDYSMEKCNFCDDKMLINELEEVYYPYFGDLDDSDDDFDDCKTEDTHPLICSLCKVDNCCKRCDDYCCEVRDNKFVCDVENCGNIFCEDCFDEVMLYCSGCEEKFCCKKVYEFIGTSGDYEFSCDGCITIIYPQF